jgi:hypothetical protein
MRVLVFADALGPSQQIAFVEGLAGARARGEAAVRIVEEEAFGDDLGPRGAPRARALVDDHIEAFGPTVIVLSRFGHGAGVQAVFAAARAMRAPVVFHIDDDLYDMPPTVGLERSRAAHHPRRIMALARVLADADLVMAATRPLACKLERLAGHGRIGWLDNGTAGTPPPRRPAKPEGEPIIVGYMGSASHGPDLEMAVPALNAALERFPNLRVELFGSIARQPVCALLPSSVVRRDVAAGDYRAFRRTLADLKWDIGLAPLRPTPYNRFKTATKWAEYAEAGIATLASDIEVYQPMIATGAAAGAAAGQWTHLLERLIASQDLRRGIVDAADTMLAARYGWDRLEASVLGLLGRARPRQGASAEALA